jgi:hypothetical protein
MTATWWIFLAYVCLVFYDLGMTWVLQLMHYPLYHNVGAADFSNYVQANNQRAALPAILPALATLVVSLLLVWRRPNTVTILEAWLAVTLNVAVLVSTAVWQGRLHGQLVELGKSDAMIDVLVRTNWIRTGAFTIQGALVIRMLVDALTRRL